MGVYDAIKDALKAAQSVDNVGLINTLLDAQKAALDMQEELMGLREKVKRLEDTSEIAKRIVRTSNRTIFTVLDDEPKIQYCSRCWDKDKNLIQVYVDERGDFQCPECDNKGLFSDEMRKEYDRKNSEALQKINSGFKKPRSGW